MEACWDDSPGWASNIWDYARNFVVTFHVRDVALVQISMKAWAHQHLTQVGHGVLRALLQGGLRVLGLGGPRDRGFRGRRAGTPDDGRGFRFVTLALRGWATLSRVDPLPVVIWAAQGGATRAQVSHW